MIAPNIILIWPNTHASIPSGWSRETTLDGYFPKSISAGGTPGATGGSNSHSHTATANHSHTMASHGHQCTLYEIGSDGSDSDSGGTELTQGPHSHTPTISSIGGYGTGSGALSSVGATYAAQANNNHPPYMNLIFIKQTGWRPIPSNAIVLWNTATPPTGFTICDGSGGTPDLRNKYMRGMTTGGDAGSTGGATSHNHPLTHTHSEDSHGHGVDIYESGYVGDGCNRGQSGVGLAPCTHYHRVVFNNNTAGSISSETLVCPETVEPSYKKTLAIKNTSGSSLNPVPGIIGLWLGSTASIPPGWFLCDGNNGTPDLRSYYIKIANTTGEIGSTGGSNTHTHASQGHTHTGGTHTHSWNSGASDLKHNLQATKSGVGGGRGKINADHAHDSCYNIQNAVASWNSSNTAADSQPNEPEYKTVAYVMLKYVMGGGLFFSML